MNADGSGKSARRRKETADCTNELALWLTVYFGLCNIIPHKL